MHPSRRLGSPRLHLRRTDSTNLRARRVATDGAPHGTLVTAAEQSAGRGRQGRTWTAPPGRALLMSLVVRDPPRLLPLLAGVAVAETCDAALATGDARTTAATTVKWPNDVLDPAGRKLAGILVEGRPQEGWAVLGIGLNVAIAPGDFPPELQATAGTLNRDPAEIEPILGELLERLEAWLAAPDDELIAAVNARDALRGRPVTWSPDHRGTGAGIDAAGRLRIDTPDGGRVTLDAGEVHLGPG